MGSFQAGMLVEQVNVTTTTGGTTTLVAATSISATLGKQNQIFTGSLGETIVLPDATTMIVGQSFNIFNQSSSALTIEFNGGGAFTDASLKSYTTLSANTSLEITLQDNTSGGTPTNVQGKWAVIASSSGGTGAPGPTVQKFLSGSGTYTTPANVSFIKVQMVGGGGGGGGSATNSSGGTGGTGGTSTFGTSLLSAVGGSGGGFSVAGAGGTASLGSGPIGTASTGNAGGMASNGPGGTTGVYYGGAGGGNTIFGGAGPGGVPGAGPGSAGVTNSGSGGGGGGAPNYGNNGGGGGAAGLVDAIIASPSATYSYAVGAAGTAGSAGSGGVAGGAGGSGYIVVTEYYFNGLGASAGNGGAYTPTVSAVSATTTNHGTNSVTGNFSAVGSGTYTTPNNCSYIRVRMCGGGGGGAGSDAGGLGTSGGSTTFGTSLLTCTGGANASGTSGSGTINSPAFGVSFTGGVGQGSCVGVTNNYFSGPAGGANPLGGAGNGVEEANGSGGIPNTGAGGAGGGLSSAGAGGASGDGGSAGGYLEAIIVPTTNQTFSYTVGAGGSGGANGTNGYAGGPGGSGFIEVTEYYNNGAVGTATQITGQLVNANLTAPTVQKFTSGSGTYTTPTSPRTPIYIKVRAIGGGGGGGASGSSGSPTGGSNGNNTTFGPLTAGLGGGGAVGNGGGGGAGGSGGSASLGSGPIGATFSGGAGFNSSNTIASTGQGGGGGAGTPFAGGGSPGLSSTAGGTAPLNTGGGGGGAGGGASFSGGGGGGAGGFVDAIITSPSSTYSYVVGAGGAGGGTGGGNGSLGGNGATGIIIVEEHYQ